MKTLYKYNPNINQVQTFKLIYQDKNYITIENEKWTEVTELIWDLNSYSNSRVDAVERFIAWFSDRMEALRRQSKEIVMQHTAAVDLYEELTEQ